MNYWKSVYTQLLGFLLLLVFASSVQAQVAKPVRILFLLDGSSSMLDDWQPGVARFSEASTLINTIVDSIQRVNPNVEFALRVFGHQYTVQQQNCTDTKLEVPFGLRNQDQMKARLKYLSPRGVSPIAYSLKKTADENFNQSGDYSYSIILLTDGGESCGGNICDIINKFIKDKIAFKPYILSLIENYDLKKDYDCFGEFINVSKPELISPAIKTILDDNRLMYEKNDGKFAQTKLEPAPEVKKEPIVLVDTPIKPVEVVKEVPKVNERIASLSTKTYLSLGFIPYRKIVSRGKTQKTSPPILVTFIPDEPPIPAEKPKEKVELLASNFKLSKVRRIPNIWVYDEALPTRSVAKIQKVIFIPDEPVVVKVVPKPEPKPVPKPTPKPQPQVVRPVQKEAPIKVETTKSEDTKVVVYFTDGRGKYYKTEPKIDFVNVKTNKVVQSNYRLVDRSTGTPDPIKIPPGTYRIARAGSSFKSATFTVEEHTTDRIDVVISKGSIQFRYQTNFDRPMVEYYATIQNSVERGPLFRQRCDELLEYDPGIYHIEINTLPISVKTLPDLKFGEVTLIDIPEPGTLVIENPFRGKVQLWYQRGVTFEPFYDFDLTGNPADQKLNLQPGPYKVYFFKNGKEQMLSFSIKSNKETPLTL